jgi:hypothetical protein
MCLKHGARSCFNPCLSSHSAPDPLCTCGIYGVFARWNLEVAELAIHEPSFREESRVAAERPSGKTAFELARKTCRWT